MASFLPDTSCIVAAVTSWHTHHQRAFRAIEARLERRQHMVVAAPSLIEAYSVLTRLPAPHRVAPPEALRLLDENFVRASKCVALNADSYVELLRNAPNENVSGGRIYDAIIAACARRAGVEALLTFNASDFAAILPDDVKIVVP